MAGTSGGDLRKDSYRQARARLQSLRQGNMQQRSIVGVGLKLGLRFTVGTVTDLCAMPYYAAGKG